MVLTWSTKDGPGRLSYLQVPDMNPQGASIGWTASGCKVVLYRELRACFFVVWVLADGRWLKKSLVADKNSRNMRRTPLYIIICSQLKFKIGICHHPQKLKIIRYSKNVAARNFMKGPSGWPLIIEQTSLLPLLWRTSLREAWCVYTLY